MNLSDNNIAIKFHNVSKSYVIGKDENSSFFNWLFTLGKPKSSNNILNVLESISFEIKKGDVFGIIGKNGVGKSTILKLISGIIQCDDGLIETHGSIVPLIELGVGFQPEATAKENIIMYGLILGLSMPQIKNKVNAILKFAELEKFVNTKIKNFSSGMYSRLAFSTAIQVNPDILLIDEVLAVGDIFFQKKSFDSIRTFKNSNKTIVLVSQNTDMILELCNKAILLENGKIIKEGTPTDVLEQYRHN